MRAAGVRSKDAKDAAAAIASCLAIVERFGPARDVHALLLPLLEAQHRWAELCTTLEGEASFLGGAERAAILSRLGNVRLQRLRDAGAAIAAFAAALAADAGDKIARGALEKLTSAGDQRLEAARVLEPIYRREGATAPLVKVLELRGALGADVDERLGALREAATLAEGAGASEAARAVDIVGKALAEAVAAGRPFAEWLERLDRLAKPGTDPKRRAAILVKALGELPVTSDDSGTSRGEPEAPWPRAATLPAPSRCTAAPSRTSRSRRSSCRASTICCAIKGSPTERIALYRAALGGAGASRRRELLHRIGGIERTDLHDAAAAIATYRQRCSTTSTTRTRTPRSPSCTPRPGSGTS